MASFICSILIFVGPSFSCAILTFLSSALCLVRPTCTKEDHKTIEILEAYPAYCLRNCGLVDTWCDDMDKKMLIYLADVNNKMLICLVDVDVAVAFTGGFYLNWV